jgi:dipeptide/tripeptide permease
VALLVCSHLVLAAADGVWAAALGAGLWGLQMGVTQGLIAASVADAAPEWLRGTAFGIYYFVDGVVSLLASSGAGLLWVLGGSALTFGVGAALAAAAGLMVIARPLPQ